MKIHYLIIFILLAGCTVPGKRFSSSTTQSACAACVGPYDVTLTSHREALTGG